MQIQHEKAYIGINLLRELPELLEKGPFILGDFTFKLFELKHGEKAVELTCISDSKRKAKASKK